MTKKRKRPAAGSYRPPGGSRPSPARARTTPRTSGRAAGGTAKSTRGRSGVAVRASGGARRSERGTSRTSRPGREALSLSPFMPTFARAMLVVGSSPIALVSAFSGAVAIWAIYAGFHSVRVLTPSEMAQILSLPPMHSLLDLRLVLGGTSSVSPTVTIGLASLLLVARAALLAFLISLFLEILGRDSTERAGTGTALRRAASRVPASLARVFLIEVMFLAILSFVGGLIQSFLGLVGLAFVLALEVYYLLYAPIIVVVDGAGLGDAFALSVRVARRTSKQNLLFSSAYVLFTLFFLVIASPFASASPSIQVWAYVLFMTFLHVAVLATVVLRWLAVRQEVQEGTSPRPSPRRGWFPRLGSVGDGATS